MTTMQAAFYERTGAAAEVLQLGTLPRPEPGAGELRVRLQWSGVNPSDVKSRAGLRSKSMTFPRVVPHSDGMGVVDAVGSGVHAARIGQRVWVWNAAWGRAFGTAAQWVVLPAPQAVALPDGVAGEAAACFGIPALTALHALLVDGGVAGQQVLVMQGTRLAPEQIRLAINALCKLGAITADDIASKTIYGIEEQWRHPELRAFGIPKLWALGEGDYVYSEEHHG